MDAKAQGAVTPLHVAAETGCIELVSMLLKVVSCLKSFLADHALACVPARIVSCDLMHKYHPVTAIWLRLAFKHVPAKPNILRS